MINAHITVDVAKIPEVLWTLCRDLADVLREAAAEEADAYTSQRLLELAASFECGGRGIDWPTDES